MSILLSKSMGVLAVAFALLANVAFAKEPTAQCAEIMDVKPTVNAEAKQYAGKILVLDTNILINDPDAISKFPGAEIYLHVAVLAEIDRQKEDDRRPDLQYKARRAARTMREWQKLNGGSLNGGIPVGENSHLHFYREQLNDLIPQGFSPEKADNLIVATALDLQKKNPDKEVIFVSNDLNPSHLANIFGLQTLDMTSPQATTEKLFTGVIEKDLSVTDYAKFKRDGTLAIDDDFLVPNQFVILNVRNQAGEITNSVATRFDAERKILNEVPPLQQSKLPINPRNLEQEMALNLLMDPKINLVTIIGKAGSGKTLLAMAAGLYQAVWAKNSAFDSIMITRPTVVVGEEQGFLPGDEKKKVEPYLQPYFDNLDFLIKSINQNNWSSGQSMSGATDFREPYNAKVPLVLTKKQRKRFESLAHDEGVDYSSQEFQKKIYDTLAHELAMSDPTSKKVATVTKEQLLNSGKVEIVNLAYIRGRSLPNKFIIVDEAQNLTAHEIKTIITRAGEGTKIVLIGDIGQIDNKALSSRTNGLALVVNLFREEAIAGHMTLAKSERSELAESATRVFEKYEDK